MSFELACQIKHETANAILVYDYATEEEVWIPLSQVEEIHRAPDGSGSVVMTDWIARQKGLL